MKQKMNISKNKTKGRTQNPTLSIEPEESGNNNNAYKDMPLFSEVIEKFSEIEIKFILLQLNTHNIMGKTITKESLCDIEQAFILKVVSSAPVAEYGSLLKNIIQTKLLNHI